MTSETSPCGLDGRRIVQLPDRAAIRLQGPDWRAFLQGLITQDVETLIEAEVRYAALLTPQGRLLYDLFVWADADGASLDVHAHGRDDLIARLRLYRLRAKVEIAASDQAVFAAFPGHGDPPAGEAWRRDPRLAVLGWRRLGGAPREVEGLGSWVHYDTHRLSLGVPDVSRDGLADKAYAVEADLDLLNGIDFKKGCFVGQETTSRMKRRGMIKSRLVPLAFEGDAPPPAAEVLAGTLRAGEVCSGVHGCALALMRLDRAALGALTVDGRAVRLDPPAWLSAALQEAPVSAG